MRSKLIEILQKAAPEIADISVSTSENESHGHYSTNVAFALSKKWRMSPVEAGQKLKEAIVKADTGGFLKKIDVVNPGFVNFWLSNAALQAELKEILKKKTKYGRPISKEVPLPKIQIEFVSANPTGPLTMANGRGGFLGDVLANVLEFTGQKTEREYYVNDTGNQIITLGKSLIVALGYTPRQPVDEQKLYKGDYIKKWAAKNKAFIKKNQTDPLVVGQRAAKDFLADIKKIVEKMAGIHFDCYTSEERDIHQKKLPQAALAVFKKKGLVYEKEGATWLKTTKFGDDKDRVLITCDGYPTYFLADAGHVLETKKRGFDEKILILGPDHYGYVARIKAASQLVGLAKSYILVTQTIRLVKDGKEMKMSKRKGEFLTFEDVVSDVGADAMRFMFLMYAPTTHIDFDLKLAKERSLKNPVYYVQYAYVRAANILRKSKGSPSTSSGTKNYFLSDPPAGGKSKDYQKLDPDASAKLLRELIKFPEIVADTANDHQVHRLTRYATELSRAFHNFYEKERIVGEKDKFLAAARLELVKATEIVLGNTLGLLGVSKPKKM